MLYQYGWREEREESNLLNYIHVTQPINCMFKVNNVSAMYKVCSGLIIRHQDINEVTLPFAWNYGQIALLLMFLLITLNKVLVKSWQEFMVHNEKLPFGRCSWSRCSENIKDVVSFSKWKKHLFRGVPMNPYWKASHKYVFLGYLQSFRTKFSQEQLQLLLSNTTK